MADTINQTRAEGYQSRSQLEKALEDSASNIRAILSENKKLEQQIAQKKLDMENRYIIDQNIQIYKYAKNHPNDKKFHDEYSHQLAVYKAAVNESFKDKKTLSTTKVYLKK